MRSGDCNDVSASGGSGDLLRGIVEPLPRTFYEPSARKVAPLLLGQWLLRRTSGGYAGGVIVETEAYVDGDPASHGCRGMTARNKSMFGPPGHAYVYFIYGNHWCFNTVCHAAGIAEAVLMRAIEPAFGAGWMSGNRSGRTEFELTNGPAKLCHALAIDRRFDAIDLTSLKSDLIVALNPDREACVDSLGPVVTTTRIGISRAAELPLRFYLKRSGAVSRRVRDPAMSSPGGKARAQGRTSRR